MVWWILAIVFALFAVLTAVMLFIDCKRYGDCSVLNAAAWAVSIVVAVAGVVASIRTISGASSFCFESYLEAGLLLWAIALRYILFVVFKKKIVSKD